MANQQHVDWLLEGVEAWNARRQSHNFTPDLSGARLYAAFRNAGKLDSDGKIPLAGANLFRADLTSAGLAASNLTNATLLGSYLNDAFLMGADLTGAHLSFANLTNAYLEDAKLTDAKFEKTITSGINLAGAQPWQALLYSSASVSRQYHVNRVSKTSCGKLLDTIHRIKAKHDGESGEENLFYFRGEPRSGWALQPSVFRDGLISYENEMLRELTSRRPDEFSNAGSAIAQWVLAQHHGLNTRFLDITKNPLVALLFACEHYDQGDFRGGRLHIFVVPRLLVKPYNSDTVSVVANFAKLSNEEQGILLGKKEGFEEKEARRESDLYRPGLAGLEPYEMAMGRLYQLIQAERPYFVNRIDFRDLYRVLVVEPQQSSERIRAQSGAFLTSAFHERFERDEVLERTKNVPIYAYYQLTIPHGRKAEIREELALMNITRETLFPGLDGAAKAVIDEARRRTTPLAR